MNRAASAMAQTASGPRADEPEGFHHVGFVVHRLPEAPRANTPCDPASPTHAPGLPLWTDEVFG